MQSLKIYQSLWAMERRHTDGIERSLGESLKMIADAGFQGVSGHCGEATATAQLAAAARDHGLEIEGQCFPVTIDDLKPAVENAVRNGVRHVDMQPDYRPRRFADAVRVMEGWQRIIEDCPIPVYVETHRDRMTTDLFATLDLLEALPGMKLLGDISHYLVGREFAWPVDPVNQGYMRQILDACWAFHGRVASREQVQIEIGFAHHKPYLDQFLDWWAYGFASWKRRSGPDDVLVFTCELGPKPYAITGADGNDLSDRWEDSKRMKALVRDQWDALDAMR